MWLVQLLSGLWSSLGWSITWQLAVLAALAWACHRLLRVRHPGATHALWWFVLLAPLVLAPLRLTLARHEAAVTLPVPAPAARMISHVQMAPATPAPAELAPAAPSLSSPPSALPEAPAPIPSLRERLGWPGFAALLWLIGCAAVGLRLLLGHRWVRAMLRKSRPVDDEALLSLLSELREAAGVAVPVALQESRAVGAPVLYGWRRPVIVLPEEWLRALGPGDLRALLAHEVAHVARRDFTINAIQRLLALPLFFHPAVWLANRHISLAREQLCDSWAADRGADPGSYAYSLMAAAVHARARFALVSVGVAEDRSTLFQRVEAIMSADGARRISRKLLLAVTAVLLVSAAAFAAVQLSTEGLTPDLQQAITDLQSPDALTRLTGAGVFWQEDPATAAAVPALLRIVAADPNFVPHWPGTQESPAGLAFQALGGIGQPAFPPLLAALKDPDPAMRRAAALGLWSAVGSIGALPAHAIIAEPLLALLQDEPDPQVRVAAAVALAATGDTRADHEYLRYLRTDPDPKVRSLVAEGLGPLVGQGGEGAETLFDMMTHDEDQRVRERAAWNLSDRADAVMAGYLLQALRSPDPAVRIVAAASIHNFNDEQTANKLLPELIKLLKDPNPEVRAAALQGMGASRNMGGLRDAAPVIAALRDRSPKVRAAAAAAFEGSSDPRAIAPLLAAARDPDAPVREAAVKSLGWLRNPKARDAFVAALKDSSPAVRQSAAQGLAQLKLPDTAPALIAALRDSDARTRAEAAAALSQVPSPQAAAPLRALLQDPDLNVRGAAATAVGARHDPGAAAALTPLLSDSDPRLRAAGAFALGMTGDKQAVPPLMNLLSDSSPRVVTSAVVALGRLQDARAVPALVRLLDAPDGHLAQEAARALGEIDDPSALDPLVAAAQSSAQERRWSAVAAIGRINGPIGVAKMAPLLHSEDPKVREVAVRALQWGKDPGIVDAVLPLLKDPNAQVRAATAEALGRTSDPRVAQPLLEALHDPHEVVRDRAHVALGSYHPVAAADIFIAALGNSDARIRSQAVSTLASMSLYHPEVREKLAAPMISVLERGDDQTATALAIDALAASHDPRAVKAIIGVARRRSGNAASYALSALGRTGGPEAEQFLVASLKDRDAQVRRTAAEGLAELHSRAAAPHLVPLLKDKNPDVRFEASMALAAGGDRRAVPLLLLYLRGRDDMTAGQAAQALGQIGDRRTIAPLWTAAQRPEGYGRVQALAALAKFHDPRVFSPLLDELQTINGQQDIAAEALGDLGDKRAVGPLMQVLHEYGDDDYAPAIAAAHALGKLGDKRAVPELISSMQRYQQNPRVIRDYGPSHMLEADATALRALTGQDFGPDPAKWQQWWEQRKAER